MLIGIDRIIIPIDERDREQLSERLIEAGLVYSGDTGLADHPTADAHYALEGGGFIELVWERDPGAAPFRRLFSEMPRVAGIGFTSTQFDADRQAFANEPGAWLWRREREGREEARSAGPAPVGEEDPYLFLIADQTLPYAQSGASGRLASVSVAGAGAAQARQRYEQSLRIPFADNGFTVGETRIEFACSDLPGVSTSLVIEAAKQAATIELAKGSIVFRC